MIYHFTKISSLVLVVVLLMSCKAIPRLQQKKEMEALAGVSTVQEYDAFLEKHPKTTLRETIIHKRDKLILDEAVAQKSIPMIREFLEKYPETPWKEQANHYIEKGLPNVDEVYNIKTRQEYDRFIEKYPRYEWTAETTYFREGAILEGAIAHKSDEEIKQFLSDYPQTKWVEYANHFLKHGYETPDTEQTIEDSQATK